MRLRLTGIAILGVALAGCGGDSEPESAQEVSGVLRAGGMAGVSYSTPTRHGTTDSAGTFRYLPGETVTFSIGGIRLGSVPGAAVITPFTLAGLTPPTTEYALRRELDRAQRTATPFVRATNMQRLFMALDADNDPATGYDLRNAETRLAGATIDLDLRLNDFARELNKLAPNLTQGIPLSRPVVQLYREAGIIVPVHGQTRAITTRDFYPVPTEEFMTYAADGARQSRGASYDDDADSEALDSWQYDAMGRLTTVSSLYTPAYWLPPQVRHFTYEYDARGTLLGGYDEIHQDDDGLPDLRYRYDLQPDAFGYPLLMTMDLDVGVDGIIDRREAYRREYDARHNQTAARFEADLNVDGIQDWRVEISASYDASDRVLGSSQDVDDDADGVLDARYRESFDYGSAGITVYENLHDADGDGVMDLRFWSTTRRDRAGNVTSVDEDHDYDNDGVTDYSVRVVSTYDDRRHLLTQQRREDFDGDGTFDSSNASVFTYDDIGNRLTARNELDDGVDGQIEAWVTETFEYGTSGEWLGARTDFLAPSNPEPAFGSTTVVTQTPFADGVLLLASEYLDWGVAGAVAAQ
jgi:hypothetical protein